MSLLIDPGRKVRLAGSLAEMPMKPNRETTDVQKDVIEPFLDRCRRTGLLPSFQKPVDVLDAINGWCASTAGRDCYHCDEKKNCPARVSPEIEAMLVKSPRRVALMHKISMRRRAVKPECRPRPNIRLPGSISPFGSFGQMLETLRENFLLVTGHFDEQLGCLIPGKWNEGEVSMLLNSVERIGVVALDRLTRFGGDLENDVPLYEFLKTQCVVKSGEGSDLLVHIRPTWVALGAEAASFLVKYAEERYGQKKGPFVLECAACGKLFIPKQTPRCRTAEVTRKRYFTPRACSARCRQRLKRFGASRKPRRRRPTSASLREVYFSETDPSLPLS